MGTALERFRRGQVDLFQEQAQAQEFALRGAKHQHQLALANIEAAALVTYHAMDASRHVHLAADYFASRVPSCQEGVEMLAQAYDLGAAMQIQSLLGRSRL